MGHIGIGLTGNGAIIKRIQDQCAVGIADAQGSIDYILEIIACSFLQSRYFNPPGGPIQGLLQLEIFTEVPVVHIPDEVYERLIGGVELEIGGRIIEYGDAIFAARGWIFLLNIDDHGVIKALRKRICATDGDEAYFVIAGFMDVEIEFDEVAKGVIEVIAVVPQIEIGILARGALDMEDFILEQREGIGFRGEQYGLEGYVFGIDGIENIGSVCGASNDTAIGIAEDESQGFHFFTVVDPIEVMDIVADRMAVIPQVGHEYFRVCGAPGALHVFPVTWGQALGGDESGVGIYRGYAGQGAVAFGGIKRYSDVV